MHALRRFSITLIAFFWCNASMAAPHSTYISECALALRDDVVQHNSNYILRYAYLNLLLSNKSNFDKASADGSLKLLIDDVPVGFDYSQTSVKQYTEQIKNDTRVVYDTTQSDGYVSSTLSSAGAAAFSKCVKDAFGDAGVILTMADTDKTVANVKIEYTGLTGIREAVLDVTVVGGTFVPGKNPNGKKFFGKGEASAAILRNANESLSVVVNIRANGASLKSDSILVPRFASWINVPIYSAPPRVSPSTGHTCGWYNGLPMNGETVSIQVRSNNERLLPDTAMWVRERQEGPLAPARTSYGSGYYDWDAKTAGVVSGHAICNPSDAAVEAVVAGHFSVVSVTRHLVDENRADAAANSAVTEFVKNRIIRLKNAASTTK